MKFKIARSVLFITAFFALFVLSSHYTKAELIDVSGGIKNEYDYEEYVFITGEPLLFTGTSKNVNVTIKESKGKLTETYKLTLTGPGNSKITRNFTYVSEVTNYDQIGQSTANGEVTKYSEKITIGSDTYDLSDYQYSNGKVTDNRPASDYFSGNVLARKTYTKKPAKKGDPTETIVVNTDSRDVGYENFWGATDTQITEYEYIFNNGSVGYVKNRVSSSKSRVLNYETNEASLGSFAGGYAVISSSNAISEYTYQLPNLSGTRKLDTEYMPRIERLIVPKFRDLSAHWAKNDIEKLYSLGILDDQSNFFSPNTPMSRFDFTVAIGKAVDLRVMEDKKKKNTTSLFNDVKRTAKDYQYLASAFEKGIINGTGPKTYNPQGSITREQAAIIMVRALGLETKAPDPSYKTNFVDDYRISAFARDGVYVMSELGLMNGNDLRQFNPLQPLSRAEASAILVRFLEYLEDDLKQNYRDDVLFFN